MTNYVCEGERIQVVTPSGGYVSGTGYLVGDKFCVASLTTAEGEVNVMYNEGVFILPKATGAIAIGKRVFWDDSAKKVTATATANTLIGYAYVAAASGDATMQVLLVDNTVMQSATVAAVSTATATDLATAVALTNATKTALNDTLAALKAAGIMLNA